MALCLRNQRYICMARGTLEHSGELYLPANRSYWPVNYTNETFCLVS